MGLHAMEGRTVDIKEPQMSLAELGLSRMIVMRLNGRVIDEGRHKIIRCFMRDNTFGRCVVVKSLITSAWYYLKDMQNESY
jgi:hypothetical protein